MKALEAPPPPDALMKVPSPTRTATATPAQGGGGDDGASVAKKELLTVADCGTESAKVCPSASLDSFRSGLPPYLCVA